MKGRLTPESFDFRGSMQGLGGDRAVDDRFGC
jgi:hypothetical protein